MIRNFKPARQATYSRTTIEFGYINDGNSGFTFDCDTNGKPVFNTEAAEKSYRYCLEHPELFSVFNERIEFNYIFRSYLYTFIYRKEVFRK